MCENQRRRQKAGISKDRWWRSFSSSVTVATYAHINTVEYSFRLERLLGQSEKRLTGRNDLLEVGKSEEKAKVVSANQALMAALAIALIRVATMTAVTSTLTTSFALVEAATAVAT